MEGIVSSLDCYTRKLKIVSISFARPTSHVIRVTPLLLPLAGGPGRSPLIIAATTLTIAGGDRKSHDVLTVYYPTGAAYIKE